MKGINMKSIKNIKKLCAYALGVSGFVVVPLIHAAEPIKLKNTFNLEEVKWVKEVGNSSVKGKAYLKLPSGEYKGCGGFNIELLPVAKYSSERIYKNYGNNEKGQLLLKDNLPKFVPDAKEYHEMLIKGKCNENDEFSFGHVKSGDYYVIAFIIWDNDVNGKVIKDGGAVMQRIYVADNTVVEAVLKN